MTTLKGIDRSAMERRLLELGLAGRTPNTREANLRAIRMMLDGSEFYTFGIRRVADALARGMLDEAGVVALMARANGLASGAEFLADCGVIQAAAAFDGLVRAARLFRRCVRAGATLAFGTGHPGAMISCYNRLAAYARSHGATVALGEVGAQVGVDWYLDHVGDVAVTSDYCGVLHGHSVRPMDAVIETWNGPIDLIIGDHGHAGSAINHGIACIAVMDTNDPALEVAKHLEVENLVVVPLYDNRPNAVTAQLADLFLQLVEAEEEAPVGRAARAAGVTFDR
ncbi:MAG TPA: phosphatase [Stenomitos sp.]